MPQQMTHDDYTALMARYQSQRDTLTPEQVELIEKGESDAMGATAFSVALTPCYDAYNPSPQAKAQAQQAAQFAAATVAANMGEYQPPVKDRAYYRSRYRAGFAGRTECTAHRQSMGLDARQYAQWLNTPEPRATAHSSTDAAVQWAEAVLRPGAA